MKKKILSILTAMAMCLSLLPASVLAEDCESHIDENHDHRCDVCGAVTYRIDENGTCAAEDCEARETGVSGDYIELNYRCDENGEAVADGKVEISAVIYDLDKWYADEPFDPAAGVVSVVWTDTKTVYDDALEDFIDISTEYPAESGAVTLDENGKAQAVFSGIPVDALGHGSLEFDPADANSAMPSSNGLVIEYQENIFRVNVGSNTDTTINGVEESRLYFLAGSEVTVAMPEGSQGTCVWTFDPESAVAEYREDGMSISFTMPEGDVYLDAELICDTCTNLNDDHWCDLCGGKVSECVDEDGDHCCDICMDYMPELCADEDNNHMCDVCMEFMPELCADEDNNHMCDVCWENMTDLCEDEDEDHVCDICSLVLSWLCYDEDGDHFCDQEGCEFKLSWCEDCDFDGDNCCDLCGAGIYPDPGDLNVEAEAGDGSITVTWSPIAGMVGEDALAGYTVVCIDTENGDYDSAVKVTFTPDDCPFTYTFTELTNDVAYDVSVEASYIIAGEGDDASHSISAGETEIPIGSDAQVPGLPEIQNVTYGDGSITLSWTDPADNGAKIREYYVQVESEEESMTIGMDAAEAGSGEVKSYTVKDLTNAKSYRVSVCAVNAVGSGEYAYTEAAIPLIPYKLIVGGVQITEENMADVLGDGAVSFDPEERVLTLNHADIRVTEGNYGIDSSIALTIALVGENNLSCTGFYGLLGRNATTICGDGTLNVSGSDFGIYTFGHSDASLTICGSATVNAISGDVAGGDSFGIRSAGSLTISQNAVVTAAAGSAPGTGYGIYAGADFIVCDNAKVTAKGGKGAGSSIGIYIYDPFVIAGNAVVTARADESAGRSCGTYPLERLDLLDSAVLDTAASKAGNDSYGMRTTDVNVSGGTLIAVGGEGVHDSLGIHTQGFELSGGSVSTTANSTSVGPSLGMRVTKLLNVSGGELTAAGGDAPAGASCGIYAGDGMRVEAGTIKASGGSALEYSHGIETDSLTVTGGEITAQAAGATGEDGYSWGIQAYNGLDISGGKVNAQGGDAARYSYGIQTTGEMHITGGTLKAVCGSAGKQYALWSFNEMTLDSSLAILVPAQGKQDNSGEWYWTISDAGGNVALRVEIGTPVPTGAGGSSAPTYAPSVERTENGAVSVTPRYPGKGDKVTIKTEPDAGYMVADIVVTDKQGNKVALTDHGDGTYSFTQPVGKVNIRVDYVTERCLSEDFIDLDSNAWYHDAVNYVLRRGLMTGVSEDLFAPDLEMSRGMLVTILWSLEGKPAVKDAMSFTDVPADSWYADAVRWAASQGIVSGYGNGLFGAEDTLTREQLAAILYSYERSKGGGFTGAWMFRLDYADIDQISEWAYEPMCWMTMKGIISGKGDRILDAGGSATRAEGAQMLMRYLLNQES